MKKTWIIVLLLFFLIGGVVFIKVRFFDRGIHKFSWEEGTQSISNPDRGFYVQLDASSSDRIYSYYEESGGGFRMMLLTFTLSKYCNESVLPEKKLEELKLALTRASEIGIGVVLRTAYDFTGDYTDPEDFSTVLAHAKQTSKIVNLFPNTVMGVQAGFIGPYGEWHSSKYMEDNSGKRSYRVLLLETLLDHLDPSIIIDIRRPMFIREAKNAGLDTSRLGFHNDALLSTDNDMGTYVDQGYDREKELKWVNDNVLTPVNGGEMTNLSEYTNPENAVREFDLLNITYLNRFYNEEVINRWKEQEYNGQTAYQYIKDHLGYRIYLSELSVSNSSNLFQSVSIAGKIKNSGFASVPDKYKLYAVLQQGGKTFVTLVKVKKANEKEMYLDSKIRIPYDMYQEKDGLRVGLLFSDRMLSADNIENEKCIEFADTRGEFEGGVNYYIRYTYQESTKRYVLEQ